MALVYTAKNVLRFNELNTDTPSDADDQVIFQGLSDLRITTESDIAEIGFDNDPGDGVFDETLGRNIAYDEIFFVEFEFNVSGDLRSGIYVFLGEPVADGPGLNNRDWGILYSGDPLPSLSPGDDLFDMPGLVSIDLLSENPTSPFAEGRTFDIDDVSGLSLVGGGGGIGGGSGGVSIDFPPLGAPTIIGDDTGERINGTVASDVVAAGAGDDIVKTGDGDDDIELGDGADLVLAGDGNDTIRGGDGNDIIKPGRGDDEMDGGAGDDILVAFRGDEVLIGGEGNDTLLGNLDDDTLIGGAGDDRMQGGPGRDVFVFDTAEFGHDRIVLDFRSGSDTRDFSGSGLTRADLTVSQVGGNVLIEAGDNSILVNSQRFGALNVADFDADVLIFR